MYLRKTISRTNSHKLGNYQALTQSNRDIIEPQQQECELTYPEIYEQKNVTFNLEIKREDELTSDNILIVNPVNPLNIKKKTDKIRFSLKQVVEHIIVNK